MIHEARVRRIGDIVDPHAVEGVRNNRKISRNRHVPKILIADVIAVRKKGGRKLLRLGGVRDVPDGKAVSRGIALLLGIPARGRGAVMAEGRIQDAVLQGELMLTQLVGGGRSI